MLVFHVFSSKKPKTILNLFFTCLYDTMDSWKETALIPFVVDETKAQIIGDLLPMPSRSVIEENQETSPGDTVLGLFLLVTSLGTVYLYVREIT